MTAFPSDDVSVLNRLIDHANKAFMLCPSADFQRVEKLADDVRAAKDRPCEGERVLDEHTVLCALAVVLCDKALRQNDGPRARRYVGAISALLPIIQNDLLRAMQMRATARPAIPTYDRALGHHQV